MIRLIKKIIIPLSLTLCGFFLYLYKLADIPSGFHGDEGVVILFSLKILREGISSLMGVGYHNHPIMTYLPPVVTMKLVGTNMLGARLSSSLIGIIAIPIFYFFVKNNWGRQVALFSAIFLTFSHWNIAINRLALMNNQTILIGILTFFFLLRAFESKMYKDFVVAGIAAALNIYLYAGGRIIPIIVFSLLIYQVVKERKSIAKYLRNVFIFFLFFVVTALPQALFFIKNPDLFSSRFESIYIFSPGSAYWTDEAYKNKSVFNVVLEQTKKTFNISTRGGDTSGQYGYRGRVLSIPLLLFLVMGFTVLVRNIIQTKYILLLAWFFLPLVFGEIIMVDPFFFPRASPAIPPLFIIIGLGAGFVWRKIKPPVGLISKIITTVFILLVALIVYCDLYTYFVRSEKESFGDPNKYAATKISKYIATLTPDAEVVFLTAPNLYSDFAPIRFLAPNTKRINIDFPESYLAHKINAQKTVFVIYPDYLHKLNEIKGLNSEGKLIIEKNIRGDIQFYLFKINF